MSHGAKIEVLLEIRMPVGMKALAVVGVAMGKEFPGCVMRQEGQFLVIERETGKSEEQKEVD